MIVFTPSIDESLIEKHLDKARNELVLAYNDAKNSKLPDSMTGIAKMLADVSAELQYHQLRRVHSATGADTEYTVNT